MISGMISELFFFFLFASTAERLNLPFPQESVGDENLSSRWLNMGV